ncbi:tyrosine-type recombinase/integrase [Sulfurimonas sp. SAG-AH-194-L11]|nr:tyrosine-type recombinase/integrase [Sulfurimonas sp. SAG-AH-194-L11]MDF1877004.1 tyrosine-type recombinase/integrase [Sulfurimonas sp. SAG-AH-194-L11]
MAIKLSDFEKSTYKAKNRIIEVPNLYQSIKEDKNKGKKFLARFNHEGKIYSKILGYSKKDNLTPRSANLLLEDYKRDIEAGYTSSNKINLDKLFELYFESMKDTNWKKIKEAIYKRYIQKPLGKKAIENIKPMQIKTIINQMDKQGLSPRTQKSILEVLKPMFKFALENKMIKEIPTNFINVKIPNQKKIVTNATELFNKVYNGITSYYKDEPFYQALFLFAFSGRRKSEILNLRWENIDFTNNYYWITDTKNDDNQKYPLAPMIKPLLLKFKENKGLVFPSPINGGVITNVDRQMRNLKKHTGIDNLSLHYMRNILVSMLSEQGVQGGTLSGILGHKDINTINKYLSINHYKSGQEGLNKISDVLDVEIIKAKD